MRYGRVSIDRYCIIINVNRVYMLLERSTDSTHQDNYCKKEIELRWIMKAHANTSVLTILPGIRLSYNFRSIR